MNFLKAGIIFADSVVLPGGRYLAAMQTPEYGCGLENILREHADKLEGIAPGAPLAAGLGDDELSLLKKSAAETRAARASFFGVADKSQTPLFLVDSASSGEAGIDVLLEALDELPGGTALMVILGSVPASCRMDLETSLRRHAQGFVHVREPNKKQITAALAAADYFLVPATLDPQGGLLRAAIKNGVIPVIEQCPGLHGIVRDYDPVTGEGNGLVFYRHAKAALLDAMLRAVLLPRDACDQLSQRCQAMDFSWTASAAGYALLFDRLLRGANRLAA
jgi:starch synthase